MTRGRAKWFPYRSAKDIAYWKRNMLVLAYAVRVNQLEQADGFKKSNGWYEHPGEWFEGWRRIIRPGDVNVPRAGRFRPRHFAKDSTEL
ncbi:hypothetical protein [Exiguobacterium artemiae]|uniref:hypothetical protein n=1 Tax=Exiguobacterium artemiae TaxID=340145 RepID=UPI00296543D1|nr:hypothetical protein [Exiguobacterium sibiricum]MDW2886671.1 hypothetical protein [Exiguobacterium sibiricum]